ncbi:MAG: hypothetical protein ACHQFZ_03410 [Acidimicrobiales bacterium]
MSDEVKPPLTTTTSILPAGIVLGVAVVTLTVFLILNFVANPRVATPTSTLPVFVGGLATESGHLLAGCQEAGSPPANITPALIVPATTVATSPATRPNGGAGDYDCLAALRTTASPARLLGFYGAQLPARGWDLFSRGSSTGQAQLLFQKAGTDTFYWVIGVTVQRTAGDATYWTYRIYQNSSAI